ncbi:HDOD domain-containing protein [Gemmatimonas sp.]
MTTSANDTAPVVALSPEAEAFVRSVGAAADLPAFVHNVRAIGQMASNLEAKVEMLEKAIVQDVTLSAKVIKIANALTGGSAGSNGGGQVGSVKQAIMLLGYDRVQHLSSATSVFGKIEQDAPAVRDLLVESVLTANHGLQLSLAVGSARPELAYLCGLFRRLGEVLAACYRPKQFRAWQELAQRGAPPQEGDEAQVFAFTFEEVGVALANKWGMPAAVVQTMRPYRGLGEGDHELHLITQCSAEVSRAQFGAVPAESDEVLPLLRAAWAKRVGVPIDDLADCLAAALKEAAPTLRTMSVDMETWMQGQHDAHVVARLRRERELHGLTPVDGEAAALEELREQLEANGSDSEREAKLRESVRKLVALRQDEAASSDVGSVTNASLRAACEAGFERGVLGISTEDFKFVRGRVGIGSGGAELARNFVVRPNANFGPIGAALQARTDLFVELTGSHAKTYGRDRLIRELDPSQFILLPLVIEETLLGCLYFDSTVESVEATDTTRWLMQNLRDQLVAAFAKHRAARGERAEEAA